MSSLIGMAREAKAQQWRSCCPDHESMRCSLPPLAGWASYDRPALRGSRRSMKKLRRMDCATSSQPCARKVPQFHPLQVGGTPVGNRRVYNTPASQVLLIGFSTDAL